MAAEIVTTSRRGMLAILSRRTCTADRGLVYPNGGYLGLGADNGNSRWRACLCSRTRLMGDDARRL